MCIRDSFQLKQRAEALADIEQAIRRDPASPMLKEWQARIRSLPAR